MPELKRTLSGGKMNRTFDDRLIPNGEYREALNVNVGRSQSSDVGSVENILGNVLIENDDLISDGKCIGIHRDNGTDKIFMFVTNNNDPYEKNSGDHAIYEYDQSTNTISTLIKTEYDENDTDANWLDFHQNYLITGINFVDGLLFWTDNRNEPRKINVDRARANSSHYTNDNSTVIKYHPKASPDVSHLNNPDSTKSRFMENKLPRFALRYKFEDGEWSPIGPWSEICFGGDLELPATISDTMARDGEISSMINNSNQFTFTHTPPDGYGITKVEWLYNDTSNVNIYSVGESDWEDGGSELSFIYYGEEPFKVIPENQATRIYDSVPRKAQSQELVGGRIVYGNYLHNFDLPKLEYTVGMQDTALDSSNQGQLDTRRTCKTGRSYEVGIVLIDKFGRQSPVVLSNDVTYQLDFGSTASIRRLRIEITSAQATANATALANTEFTHYMPVVKCNKGAYYNWIWEVENVDSGTQTNRIELRGDNLNKVPRDTSQAAAFAGNSIIEPTNVTYWRRNENQAVVNNNSIYKIRHLEVVSTTSTSLGESVSISTEAITNEGDTDTTGTETSSGTNTTTTTTGIYAILGYNLAENAHGIYEIVPEDSPIPLFYGSANINPISDLTTDSHYLVDWSNAWMSRFDSNSSRFIEVNRIRCGFNEPAWDQGIQAFVPKDDFAEERRPNALIHSSGLFNSRVGVNASNEFNEAEGGLSLSLDPTDGSIQKLYGEDTQLLIFQEDKVSRSPIDKDFIYSAEGGAIPVTTNTQFLGTVAPYVGEYGISRNPESFAVYGTRKYFADKNRGVILRLSNDGLTEISSYGMVDFFRDALDKSDTVIGSFDEYHDLYNVTLSGDAPAFTGFEDTNIATASDGYFTLSFEEEVNGWTSFKSFNQEEGATLNNRYYTVNGGNIWEHNHFNAQYNTFYNTTNDSYVDVIFNDSPSTVKDFKTCGYEGEGDWVLDYVETDFEEYIDSDLDLDETDTVTTNLSVTSTYPNSVVKGARAITINYNVDTPSTLTWYLKLEPVSGADDISAVSDVTITGDGTVSDEEIVEGSLWFTYELTSPSNSGTHNITIASS